MKIAYTGTHGVGKTTSVFEHAHKAKLENENCRVGIFHENTSAVPGQQFNNNGSAEGQLWMFTSRICKEIELCHTFDIVICDRTIMDHIAYSLYFGQEDLVTDMYKLALHHISTYDMIIFKQIKTNNYWKKCSHRDTNDEIFRQRVEDILMTLYEDSGITKYTKKFKCI